MTDSRELTILICNLIPKSLSVAKDVLKIIVLYCSLYDVEINSYLIRYCSYEEDQYDSFMDWCNVFTEGTSRQRIIPLLPQFNPRRKCLLDDINMRKYYNRPFGLINCKSLAIPIVNELITNNQSHFNLKQIKSNDWSITIWPQADAESMWTKQTELSLHCTQPCSDIGYKINLPQFGNSLIFNTDGKITKTAQIERAHVINSVLYGVRQECLYCVGAYNNGNNNHIYCLNFNNDIRYNQWQWLLVNANVIINTQFIHSCCIDDNNKYIAILSGMKNALWADDDSEISKLHLYSIIDDTSVCMKKFIKPKKKPIHSVYHNNFHKVICCGLTAPTNKGFYSVESYDMNKNEWSMITDRSFNDGNYYKVSNIWISSINPNILFIFGTSQQQNWATNLKRVDLRENNLIHDLIQFQNSFDMHGYS